MSYTSVPHTRQVRNILQAISNEVQNLSNKDLRAVATVSIRLNYRFILIYNIYTYNLHNIIMFNVHSPTFFYLFVILNTVL